mgnify:FL=1
MHYFDSGAAMGWGVLWMLLWLGLPILAIIALVTWISRADSRRQDKSALDILKERYARGEIDRAEFEQKLHDLES